MLALGGAAAVLLLLSCVNLTGLTLVRSAARRREVALRRALGAGRGSITSLVLGEAALIAAAGVGIGHRAQRATHALVAIEVALAVLIVAGAGLMVRTFTHLRGAETGVRIDNVLGVQFGVPAALGS